jgi:uncharacterized coiled-coil protein SlyX
MGFKDYYLIEWFVTEPSKRQEVENTIQRLKDMVDTKDKDIIHETGKELQLLYGKLRNQRKGAINQQINKKSDPLFQREIDYIDSLLSQLDIINRTNVDIQNVSTRRV